MTFIVSSPAFQHEHSIPIQYTCEGQDLSPPLYWSNPPGATKSYALVVDDPDAPDPAQPKMTYVHWVLYNIPANVTGIKEGTKPEDLPKETQIGLNDLKRKGYGGPCPPIGQHRYFFKLYALDTMLPILDNPTKSSLEEVMAGHVLGEAILIGLYKKAK